MIESDGTCAASRSAIFDSKRWSNHWLNTDWSRLSARIFSAAPMVVSLGLADEKFELALIRAGRNQFVSGLLAEGLHVLQRAGIGGGDGECFSRTHGGQCLLCSQYRQGTVHAAGIQRLRCVRTHCDPPLLVDDRPVKKIGKKLPDEK